MTRRRIRIALLVVLGAAALAIHLAFGAWAVIAAARWAGFAAVAVVTAALTVLFAVHVAGLRRLRAQARVRQTRGNDHES